MNNNKMLAVDYVLDSLEFLSYMMANWFHLINREMNA